MSRFRPAGFRNGLTAWRRTSRPDSGRPAQRRSTAFRAGWTAWRRRASRNPAAPRNAVSPWEAGAPRSAASGWEAAANPWLGAIARCSRTGSSNPSPSSGESSKLASTSLGLRFCLALAVVIEPCPPLDRGRCGEVSRPPARVPRPCSTASLRRDAPWLYPYTSQGEGR
jgi:hypothetical protein